MNNQIGSWVVCDLKRSSSSPILMPPLLLQYIGHFNKITTIVVKRKMHEQIVCSFQWPLNLMHFILQISSYLSLWKKWVKAFPFWTLKFNLRNRKLYNSGPLRCELSLLNTILILIHIGDFFLFRFNTTWDPDNYNHWDEKLTLLSNRPNRESSNGNCWCRWSLNGKSQRKPNYHCSKGLAN